MKIRPLHDRVLVKRLVAVDQTSGGLFIPDTAKERQLEASVISVGNSGARARVATARSRASTRMWSLQASSIRAKVVRVALQNAASAASLMLTAEALIVERTKSTATSAATHIGRGGLDR